jgi:glycosyltransferase involved in cell wall biosynthesis
MPSRGERPEPVIPARRPRICFVIGTLDRGGTEGQLVELAVRLRRERFDPFVCCLAHDGPHREALDAAGIPVMSLGVRRATGLLRPFEVLRRLAGLIRVMRAQRPDVVHGFLYSSYVLGAVAARVNRVPVIIASRRSLGLFKASRPFWLLVERLGNRATDHLIANSEAVRQDVLRQERLPASKVTVIHNGVALPDRVGDQSDALRGTLDLLGRHPIVAVISNFMPYKGYDVFFEALPGIVSEFPRLAVLIAGDGAGRREFEDRARASPLTGVVRFLGVRSDVPALLALADVIVHPSTEEGFSNAILEAMAAGKPVVAAAVGGNVEAIVDRETGLLVPTRDADALRGATLWMLRHPHQARTMGEAGRARVGKLFTIDRMVKAYEGVYDKMLAERGPRAHARRELTRAV